MAHKWTPEQVEFIRENYPHHSRKELLTMLNQQFNLQITLIQLVSCIKNKKIKSGRTGHFEKGHESWCAGMKGLRIPGTEKGWFKPGCKPITEKDIGYERVDNDGYVLMKVAEKGEWHERWRHKHKVVWEEVNGPIPQGHVIIFLDGDRQNCSIENLACITNAVHLQLTRNNLRFNEPELMPTAIRIGELLDKTVQKTRKLQEG